jgi:hypothetical protein
MIIIDYDNERIVTENPFQYITDNYGTPAAIFLQSYLNGNNLINNNVELFIKNKYSESPTAREVAYQNSSDGISNPTPKKVLSTVAQEKLKQSQADLSNYDNNINNYLTNYDTTATTSKKSAYCKIN